MRDVAADLESALRGRPGAEVVHFNSTAPDGLEASDRRQAGRVRRTSLTAADDPGDHRVHLRHDRPGQGHRALPPRPAGGRRHLRPPRPAARPGRHLHRLAAARLHLRRSAGWCCSRCASAPRRRCSSRRRRRCCSRASRRYRATVAVTSPTGYRAMLRAGRRVRPDQPAQLHLGRGDAARRRRSTPGPTATGIRLMDGIGSTEMLHMFIGCTAGRGAARARPAGSCPAIGRMVVDDDGHEVPPRHRRPPRRLGSDRLPLSRRSREPAALRAATAGT